ncbi:uncharacterized protein LOC124815345 [Hydra vulgaris]|uniref:uncharacterized protein LOC124815345 n=1 Tax=Hydra vulgaris TaxID=6087 RepID=UPI0032EA2AE7
MDNSELSIEELRSAFDMLQKNKSAGLDEINTNVLKSVFDIIELPLFIIFKLSLKNGDFPDQLKFAKIIPIYKNGDDSLESNYRPISILSCFSKVLERIMYNRIYNFIDKNNILYPKQFGFRRNHCTEHAVMDLASNILKGFDGNNYTLGFQIGGIDNSVLSPTSRKTKQTKASDEEIYIKEFDTIMDSDQSETSISSLNQTRSKNYNTTHYPKFALEVIRYGISDEAAGAVANALLQDIGYLHLNDVIDPSKIKKEKERVCFNASFEQSKVSNIKAIGLDSKRNKNSLVYEQRDIDGETNLCKSTSTVDHLTFTIESGELQGQYLKHIDVPKEKGKGKDLAEFTCNVLKEFKSDKSIQAIILENTSVNTGKDNGLVACLERILKRRIHLIGCLLHVNELPLRHLISKLDGSSNSSNNYSGNLNNNTILHSW